MNLKQKNSQLVDENYHLKLELKDWQCKYGDLRDLIVDIWCDLVRDKKGMNPYVKKCIVEAMFKTYRPTEDEEKLNEEFLK